MISVYTVPTCPAILLFTEENTYPERTLKNHGRRLSGVYRVRRSKIDLLGALRLRDRCLFLLCQNSWCTRGRGTSFPRLATISQI
jgi:hypothetical protein